MPCDPEFAKLVALARLVRGNKDLTKVLSSLEGKPREQLFIRYLMGDEASSADRGKFLAVTDFAYA